MKIKTEHVCPPVPFRDCDWSAVDSDTYDVDCDEDGYFSRCPIGRGRTEQAAIEDLNAQLYEEREHEPHNPLCSVTSNCTICWPEDSEDLGAEDIEDEYIDPREEYADAVCIPLRKPL